MAQSATLAIKVIADTQQARSELDQTSGRMDKFRSGVSKMAVPAAIAGAAVLAFGKQAVEAASRTQQAMGAVDTVFGKSAGSVKKWASQAAESVGLSSAQYGEMASVLGAQLKNMGVPMDQVAKKTKGMIGLGADLAATYGGTSAEAVEALGSALRGETDPIERYGISIKQADIAARMAKDGTDKLTGSALKQAKTQTLLKMITEQSGKAVGAFARESDTAAGSAQIANAQWENAKSVLGTALLPIVAALTGKLAGMAKWVSQNAKVVQILVGVVGALAAGILVLNAALKVYEIVTKAIGIVSKATWLSNPIFLVVAAVVLLVAAIVLLYKKNKAFRDFVNKMWAGIKAAFKVAVSFIKKNWLVMLGVLLGPLGIAIALIIKNWDKIKRTAVKAFDTIKGAVAKLKDRIVGVFTSVKDFVTRKADQIKDKFSAVWGSIRDGATRVKDWIAQKIGAAKDVVVQKVSAIKSAFAEIPTKAKAELAKIGGVFRDAFQAAKTAVDNVVTKIRDKIASIVTTIENKFDIDLTAPFDAVLSIINKIISTVATLAGKLGSLKVPKLDLNPFGKTAAAPTVAGQPVLGTRVVNGSSRGATAAASSPAPTIVIQGALDPEAVARQIESILARRNRRLGRV